MSARSNSVGYLDIFHKEIELTVVLDNDDVDLPPTFNDPASSATTSLGQAQEQVYEYFRNHPRCSTLRFAQQLTSIRAKSLRS